MALSKEIRVLYVDDEVENLNTFKANLRREFTIFTAANTEEAFDIVDLQNVNVVISDQKMPVETGLDFFERLRKIYPYIPKILLTGYTEVDVIIDAINRGDIYKFLTKPMNLDEIRVAIKHAFDLYNDQIGKQAEILELAKNQEQLEFMVRQKLIS